MPYTIELVTTEEGLYRLKDDWSRLSGTAEHPNVFMTFDWFRAWNQRFTQERRRSRRQLNILVLKRDGTVAGISPLVRVTTSLFGCSVHRLEFVGREWDYNDLVLGDDLAGQTEAVVQFLARTQEQWDLIYLRNVRDSDHTIQRIDDALARERLTHRLLHEKGRCPYLPLDAPWATMLSRYSTSTRHGFRTRQSRLDRMSAEGLRVRILDNPQEEPGLLNRLVALEAQKHVGGQLSTPFLGQYSDVFASLFDTLGPQGWFAVAIMELGDRLLAWNLLFRCGGKLWGYLTAYDHAFSRLSPGAMLVPAIIDYGFSRGYTEFDFLNGEEPYKMRWTTGYHHTYCLQIWNRRWISRLRASVFLALRPGPSASDPWRPQPRSRTEP